MQVAAALLLGTAQIEELLKKAGTELTFGLQSALRSQTDRKQRSDKFRPTTRREEVSSK